MWDEALLARVEDAGINASAPPQQVWLDGWIVRFSPGSAKRARCVNAVATGRMSLDHRLERAASFTGNAGLPLIFRLTPFTQPPALEGELAQRGFEGFDETRVMISSALPVDVRDLPSGLRWSDLGSRAFADAVGRLRGSTPAQRAAHAERLRCSPLAFRGLAIERADDGQLLATAQATVEADIAGLYDVHTREDSRGQGLATLLCQRLLSLAASHGAKAAYLQVDETNDRARRLYRRLGFSDGYGYHYRQRPAG